MRLFTMVLGAALAMGSALVAQTFDRINVHFANPVVVNGVSLQGDTSIQVLHNNGIMILAFRSEGGKYSSVVTQRVDSTESGEQPRVVMNEKDGVLYLNRIVMPDDTAFQVLDAQ